MALKEIWTGEKYEDEFKSAAEGERKNEKQSVLSDHQDPIRLRGGGDVSRRRVVRTRTFTAAVEPGIFPGEGLALAGLR